MATAKKQAKDEEKNLPAAQSTALVMVQDEMPDYLRAEGPGRGSENVGTDDIVIPRLEIVQALSPYVKDGDAQFIPEARPGMLINSVTKQLYGKEVMLVPVFYMKQWLVWGKRKDDKGSALQGGFFGGFDNTMDAEARKVEEVEKGSNGGHVEVIDTPQHLCLLVNINTGSVDEVMLSMPRTKAKISRAWNSMVRLAGGDRFSRVYRVTTQLEKKTQGDYYNFAIAQSGFPAKPLYDRAEKLYTQIAEGQRRVVVDADGLAGDETHDPNAEM